MDQDELRQLGDTEAIKNELVKEFTKHIEEPDLNDDAIVKVKLVLLGPSKAGKTCWVTRIVKDTFDQQMAPTVGASHFTQGVAIDDKEYHFDIWDVSGEEWCRSLCPMYLQHAHVAVICYDPSDTQSFAEAKEWVEYVKKQGDRELMVAFVGTKADLAEVADLPISQEVAEKFFVEEQKMEKLFFFPSVSSKSGDGVQDVILSLAETFHERGLKVTRASVMNPDQEFEKMVDTAVENQNVLTKKETQNLQGGNEKVERCRNNIFRFKLSAGNCMEVTKVKASNTVHHTRTKSTKVASSVHRNSLKLGHNFKKRTTRLIKKTQPVEPGANMEEIAPTPHSSANFDQKEKDGELDKMDG